MSSTKQPYSLTVTEAASAIASGKLTPSQLVNSCLERIDAGLVKGLKPGTDREATPACVNTCPAQALTFGDLDDPDSEVYRLIGENQGFQLHPEYNTDPSVYFIDGKIGTSGTSSETLKEQEPALT